MRQFLIVLFFRLNDSRSPLNPRKDPGKHLFLVNSTFFRNSNMLRGPDRKPYTVDSVLGNLTFCTIQTHCETSQ